MSRIGNHRKWKVSMPQNRSATLWIRVLSTWCVAGIASICLNIGSARGQPGSCIDWTYPDWEGPGQRPGPAMVFDSDRGVALLFGGSYSQSESYRRMMWEWNGLSWQPLSPATLPPYRTGTCMAYDRARHVAVLFGGYYGTYFNDTWEWDGVNWTKRTPATIPAARSNHTLVYDSARGVTVMFGGDRLSGSAAPTNETWEWNGVNWTLRTAALSPPARKAHAAAFDEARMRTVVFGGASGSTLLNDTWEWDGADWSLAEPLASPPARANHSMVYDSLRGVCLIFGGSMSSGALAETWQYDGATWTQRTPTTSPGAATGNGLVFDSARGMVFMYGGPYTRETWEWNGENWRKLIPVNGPGYRRYHAMAFHHERQAVVLFGGYDLATNTPNSVTWEWNGTSWRSFTAGPQSLLRIAHGMTYDSQRGQVVLFGGYRPDTNTYLSDTREWNGAGWVLRTPATVPSARLGISLAYDSARGCAVMFGGLDSVGSVLASTWEYDGVNWALRSPVNNPLPRYHYGLAYDSHRGVTVLFGGLSGGVTRNDTWEWDGIDWTRRFSATTPPSRSSPRMAFDSSRNLVVMQGGSITSSGALGDLWEWDGVNWQSRNTARMPEARQSAAMCFDDVRNRMVLFGGVISGIAGGPSAEYAWGDVAELGACPEAPMIGQLTSSEACAGSAATLSATATGTAPLNYQWSRGSTLLVDGANVSGAGTAALTIQSVAPADASNDYRLVVTNFGGFALSGPMSLAVFPSGGEDANGDGAINGGDIQPFVNLLLSPGPVTAARCRADLDSDGSVSPMDISAFVDLLLTSP